MEMMQVYHADRPTEEVWNAFLDYFDFPQNETLRRFYPGNYDTDEEKLITEWLTSKGMDSEEECVLIEFSW